MEKRVDRNQKKLPVLALAKCTNPGQVLLREARRSKEICLLLAKALLRPEPFFPRQPNLPTGELLTMLRLALLAPNDLGRARTNEDRGEWYDYARNLSLWCLPQRLLMPKDVRTARRVLLALQPFMPEDAVLQAKAGLNALEEKYEERRKLLTATQPNEGMKLAAATELRKLRRLPRPRRRGGRPVTSRGGRAISEHQQRIVAVAYLLEDCGEKNPENIIVSLLREQNVRTKSSKVIRTIATYKAAAETRLRTTPLSFLTIFRNIGWKVSRGFTNTGSGRLRLARVHKWMVPSGSLWTRSSRSFSKPLRLRLHAPRGGRPVL